MSRSLQDARNRFSAVLEAALRQGPQAVTRRGRPTVTVIATAECEGLCRAAAASRAHLRAVPPADATAEDDFARTRTAPRAVDLS